MKSRWLAVRQLDRQLQEWQTVSQKYDRPRLGWIKTLREILGMSAEQLADRLGVMRGRISQLEHAEVQDAVTLRSMKEAADAMGCEFVYAIVPKGTTSLEGIIKTRVEYVAAERMAAVAHSMSLEDQGVNESQLKFQKEELVKNIAEHLNKQLWKDSGKSRSDLVKKLADMLNKKEPKK